MTRKFPYIDEEEREIMEAYDRGEFVPVTGEEAEILEKQIRAAAKNYMKDKKDSRINIRLPASDLQLLKKRAAEEGLPYQTMIASILHKYATGQFGA